MMVLKIRAGDAANPNYPTTNIVQGSGSSYCPANSNIGTLGTRVDMSPNTGFYYIATYHNFAEDETSFAWIYNNNGAVTQGQLGSVIERNYTWGADKKYPLLDCALIQLNSTSLNSIAPSLFQGNGNPVIPVRGTNRAVPGMIVTKFGMTTGLTYGRVINLPTDIAPSYENYLFAVELCTSNGYPLCGNFASPGDSGAPVIDANGYVLGLVVQTLGYAEGTLGLISRIDQIQAALGVTVHTG